jgi:AcrR family transcriptional regulator
MTEDPKAEDHRVRVAARRREQMLAQLSDAALRVMARGGPEGMTVDAVILQAGVSRGTFYKYYDAPAALISAVGAELAEDLILTVSPSVLAYQDPAARLATGFRMVLRCARANPLLPRFMIRAGWPAFDRVPAFSARVGANLAAGIAQGRFRIASLPVARALVGGVVIGMMATLIDDDGGPESDNTAAKMLLLSLGLDEEEVKKIVTLPLPELTVHPGLLARCHSPDRAG